ncbi:MAG: MCP four helix bundle domain-containing protein [Desulfoprunum sp.]|nr:MCP four helix bundle domain-containing protein [Desulfoprunum sp.]
MQFPQSKGLIAVLWGVGFSMGILFFFMITKYYGPFVPMKDTYLNIVKKSEILSQMRINLLKSVEMEKNAVMAQTDVESQEFANQSLAASTLVEQNFKLLRSLIDATSLQDEEKLVSEFNTCWTEFRKLDQVILELAVQNTNLKATGLSREQAADSMRRFELALEDVIRSNPGNPNEGRVAGAAWHAITAGLQIFNLHSSHIAEISDEKMAQIETQMKVDEQEASKSLDELTGIVGKDSNDALLQAKEAFSEFMEVTVKVIKLSRQNSNIKSLELSLGRKRKVTAQCEEILATFQEAVHDRPFKAAK